MTTEIVLQLIILPILIGIVASFITWYIPAEKFKPEIVGIRYNQVIIEENLKTLGDKNELVDHKRKSLRRHIQIQNLSPTYAAYNVFYRFEFYGDNGQNVYFEGDIFPYISANSGEISIPLMTLSVNRLLSKNVVRGQFQLIYENRYGTKKKSDTYLIEEYTIDKTSYQLVLKQ